MKRLVDATEWVSSHQAVTGFATLVSTVIGLIAAVRSEDTLIRISGVVLALFAGLILLYVCWRYLALVAKWLTWKFVLGLAIGIVTAASLYPFVAPVVQRKLRSDQTKQVEFTHTVPKPNATLSDATDRIEFYFSEEMPRSQRHGISVTSVTITPLYPIESFWIVNEYSDATRQLNIRPGKYYPNERRPRYRYGMEFTIEVKGGPLKERVAATFRTPAKESERALHQK